MHDAKAHNDSSGASAGKWRWHFGGNLNGNDGPGFANNGENSFTVVMSPTGTDATGILDGFTIAAVVETQECTRILGAPLVHCLGSYLLCTER
jgi:hypothetical protein